MKPLLLLMVLMVGLCGCPEASLPVVELEPCPLPVLPGEASWELFAPALYCDPEGGIAAYWL
jgi:hypothetical protein